MLPVELPENIDLNVKGNPLVNQNNWREVNIDGKKLLRETDTLDTFVCSSWYYLRFCSPTETKYGFNKEDIDYWMPVDQYIGGVEHAILHLLYSRFLCKHYHIIIMILIYWNHSMVFLHKEWFVMKLIKILKIIG